MGLVALEDAAQNAAAIASPRLRRKKMSGKKPYKLIPEMLHYSNYGSRFAMGSYGCHAPHADQFTGGDSPIRIDRGIRSTRMIRRPPGKDTLYAGVATSLPTFESSSFNIGELFALW